MLIVMETVPKPHMRFGSHLQQIQHSAITARWLIHSIALIVMLSFSIAAQGAISWVSTGNQGSSTGSNSRSLVMPNIIDDDLLIAHIAIRGNRTISTPAGWTLIDQVYVSQNDRITQGIYYKVGAASDSGASVSWTFNGSDDNAGIIRAYRGIDTTSPIGNFSRATANSATLTAPSINTTTADEWILAFYGSADGRSDPFSTPLGMTERYDFDNGASNNNGLALAGDDELITTAGATGTRATNSSRGDRYNAQLVALKPLAAPPVPVGSCDDFESGLSNWTITSGGGVAGTSNATSNSPSNSLYLQGGVVSVTHAISYDSSAVASVDVAAWIQRGDDTISENPEAGDDLVLEYFNNVSSWIALETFMGGANVPNTIYDRSYTLNADALHTGLKLRFRMLDGSGAGWDYWHVDDVCVLESDSIPPAAPTVNSQTTNDNTPIITGTFDSSDAAGGFTVTVDGTTYTLGTDPELTNSSDDWTLDLSSATPLADGTYDVTATATDGGANSTSDATINELTINASAPTITLSAGSCGIMNQVIVVFSETMDQATTETSTNYSINNGASVISAALQSDNQTVVLTTSTLVDVTAYTITVNNVEDTGGLPIAAGSTTFFTMGCGNLVAYYPFDEASWDGTADEIKDLSGSNLHGYSVGGVTTSVAKVCNGAILDGVTAAVAQVDDPGTAGFGLDIPNELTVSVWFKTNTIPSSGLKSILSKDENYEFHIDSGGHIYWWWSASTLTTAATVSTNTWHHVAIVYESGSQKIYIDGVEDANTNNRTATMPQNNDPLQIGGDMGFVTREFDGLIDEVRIYSQAQNRAEILADMYASHPCTDPLVCSFRDNFASTSYSNDDGSLSWDTDWQESNDNNNPSGGDAYISGGELIMTNVGGGNRPELVRQLDLTGATAASLDFGYFTSGNLEVGDTFEAQISGDGGGSWRTVYSLSDDDAGVQSLPFLVSELTNNAQIKLLPTGGYTGGGEQINLYYIAVLPQGLCSAGVDHYGISHSGTGVTCEAEAVTITPHDASDIATSPSSSTTITLSTTPATDGWALKTGSGTFTAPNQYTFDGTETSVEFWLSKTTAAASVDIDVTDGSASDPDDGGAEDATLAFVDTAFRFVDTTTTNAITIGTQIGGKPSSTAPGAQTIGLEAIRTDTSSGECQPVFVSQTTSVNFGYECNDPASCSGTNLLNLSPELTYNAGSAVTLARHNNGDTTADTAVDLVFGANGIAPLSFIFDDAGQITLHATKTLTADGTTTPPTTAATLSGSSNAFVTRPFGYDLDFNTDARAVDWGDGALDGTAGDTSYATDASGSIFTTAGTNFDMTIRSVLWEAADDSNSDGIPDDRSNLTGNSVTPNFSGVALDFSIFDQVSSSTTPGGSASPTFTSGIATHTMSWSDVGVIDISVTHNNYLGDGAADITSTAFDVGRFTPDSFVITLNNSPSFAEAVSGTFTYLGQNFTYGTAPNVTIQAVAADGTTVTQNYEGSYWKLGAGITPGYTDLAGVTDSGGGAIALTAPGAAVSFGDTSNVNGQVTLTLHNGQNFSYARPGDNDTVNPFDADARLNLAALDSDTISGTLTQTNYSQHLGFSGDTELGTGNPLSGTNDQSIRQGRALLVDGYASTGSAAAMSLTLEFFDGTSFITNAADAATAFTDTLLTCSDPLGGATIACGDITITPTAPATVSNGNNFSLTPGNNNEGTLNYQLSLAASTFLRFDWDGDGAPDDNPDASITFGQYRDYHGDERFIYWREVER